MTGIELIRKSFRCEETERIPWVPFSGVHGAFLLNISAEEYLKSEKLIVEGVKKAVELYQADGIPVVFDLQVEAEALGCQIAWKKDNPPAVISHPLSGSIWIESLPEYSLKSGRIPIIARATKQLREELPNTALYGLITGPFTLALHLMGTEIFLKMMMEPEKVGELMDFTTRIAITTAEMYIQNGCDVIAVVDPMTSQIDPISFNQFVSIPVETIFDYIRERDCLSSFFVCGQAEHNIEEMCKTGPDNISIDENISLEYVKNIALANKVSFGGNLKLTANLLLGDENDCRIDALDCMDKGGKTGFVLAPGCDLPMETPVKNLQAIADLVHDPYQQDVARALSHQSSRFENPDLGDHWKDNKIRIDVITLDSSSCAPCQYMLEAMKKAAAGMEKVEVTEFPIKSLEGLKMMNAFGVKSIPTACIEGSPVFESRIPSIEVIREKIDRAIKEKGL